MNQRVGAIPFITRLAGNDLLIRGRLELHNLKTVGTLDQGIGWIITNHYPSLVSGQRRSKAASFEFLRGDRRKLRGQGSAFRNGRIRGHRLRRA